MKIWSKCSDFPLLQNLAKRILVLFGSTYICEAAFSNMKFLKNKFRSCLTDSNLECSLRLMTSNFEIDFSKVMENLLD